MYYNNKREEKQRQTVEDNGKKLLNKDTKWSQTLRNAIEKGLSDPEFRLTQLAYGIPEGEMIDGQLYIKTQSFHADELQRNIKRVFVVLNEYGNFHPLYKNMYCPVPEKGYILCIKSLAPFIETSTVLEYVCSLDKLQAGYDEEAVKDQTGRANLVKSNIHIVGEKDLSFLSGKVKDAISEFTEERNPYTNLYMLYKSIVRG